MSVRKRLSVTMAVVAAALALPAAPAQATPATPASINVDCSANPISDESITGEVGSVFTVTNTSGVRSCIVAGVGSVVQDSGLVAGELQVSATATFTISESGTFTVTSRFNAGGGAQSTATYTVTVPVVTPPAEPVIAPPALPGPPASATATAGPGFGEITVNWPASTATSGYGITLYQAADAAGEHSCATRSLDPASLATTCVVSGLTPGTAYSFSVKAFNGQGWSTASSASASVTAPAMPNAPTDVLFEHSDLGSESRLSWHEPSNVGLLGTVSYEIDAAPCAAPCQGPPAAGWGTVGSTTSTMMTVNGSIRADVPVAYRVRAVTAFGNSAYAYSYEQPPLTARLSGPANLELFADSTSLLATWETSELNDKWGAVYEVAVVFRDKANPGSAIALEKIPALRTTGDHAAFSIPKRLRGYAASVVVFVETPSNSVGVQEIFGTARGSRDREITDDLPVPDITQAYVQSSGTPGWRLGVKWKAPDEQELGSLNVVGYEVQVYDRDAQKWLACAENPLPESTRLVTTGKSQSPSLKGAPNVVRVRSVGVGKGSRSAWQTAATSNFTQSPTLRSDMTMSMFLRSFG